MVVLSPAHRSQAGRGQEDSGQTPEIDRPVAGMATGTFLAQHRDGAGNDAGEPQQDMNSHNAQEHRVGGGNFDPGDIGGSIAHVISPLAAARYRLLCKPAIKVSRSCS